MTKKNLVWSSDMSKKDYDQFLKTSKQFIKNGVPKDIFKGRVGSSLFFQPSTRTMIAFQSAMIRGGGGWIGVSGVSGLSMEKGESLEDTVRAFSSHSDVLIIRHQDEDSAVRAAASSFVPVINGGSGSKEHAVAGVVILADIYHYLGRIDNLKIGIYGTPGINRCVKALVPVLGHYGVRLVVDDLGGFPIPKEVEEVAKKNGLKEIVYDKLDNFIGDVDFLIATRGLQKGIIPEGEFPKEKEEQILKNYKPINTGHMKKLRQDAYFEMLTPCIFEVEKDVEPDPRCLHSKKTYFTENMAAIIAYLLDIKV